MPASTPDLKPIVDFIKFQRSGEPYLEGLRCTACRTVYFGARPACAKCHARGSLEPFPAPSHGRLYSFTIVHRTFPGIKSPFIHAVVDVEGGGALRGTLIGIDPIPSRLKMGMPLDILVADAGRTDRAGSHYAYYFFQPAGVATPASGGPA